MERIIKIVFVFFVFVFVFVFLFVCFFVFCYLYQVLNLSTIEINIINKVKAQVLFYQIK